MSTSLHRPEASEELVQRSGQESKAVRQYSSALRAMSQEIERHDGWGEVHPASVQVRATPLILLPCTLRNIQWCWLETQEVEAANAAGRPVIDAPDEEGAGPPLEIDMIPPKPQLKIQSGKSRLTDDGVVVGGTEQVASA